MKKVFLMLMFTLVTMCSFAQTEYIGTKFTDNWSVNVQGGVITPMSHDYFKKVSPIITIGADKYINPWFGVGVDARTAIAAPAGCGNPHTMFDAVNVSGLMKFNILRMFTPENSKFEPVIITGLGWGHDNCEHTAYNGGIYGSHNNYMTYMAGTELNYRVVDNIGIVLTPNVRWGNIDNGKLNKHNAHFEVTAGVKYYFGKGFTTHYCPEPIVREIVKNVPVIKEIEKTIYVDNFYRVGFDKNKAELTTEGKEILNKIPTNSNVVVYSSASPEGTVSRNTQLVKERAAVVADYLISRGVKCTIAKVEDSRQALIQIK